MYRRKDGLTEKIIGAAIEVHRVIGPGLLESIYEQALAQVLSYLKATGLRRGLLLNFGCPRLIDGIKQVSL